MKRLIFSFLIISSLVCNNRNAYSQSIVGNWLGSLDVGGTELRLVLKVSLNKSDSLIASLDSPDQGAKDIEVNFIELKNDTLVLKLKSIYSKYLGRINEDFDKLEGTWYQGFSALPLNFQKVDSLPAIKRPQEPKPPFPYIENEVFFKNKDADLTLAGTLTFPDRGMKFPAIILISGSGAQNRDEEILGHKPFLVIADYLTRNGFAVLRYDDRGFGESTGDFATATTENFASDTKAAIKFLQNHKKIDAGKIVLIGHSEGGMIASMIAAKNENLAGVVLLAAPGIVGKDILLKQTEEIKRIGGESEKEIRKSVKISKKIYAVVSNDLDYEKAAKKIRKIYLSYSHGMDDSEKRKNGLSSDQIELTIRQILSPWFVYFLKLDPQEYLQKTRCPVLAINGSKDLQVDAKTNLQAIEKALKIGGNSNYKILEMPGLNHLFQTAETGAPSEYSKIEETFSENVLSIINKWLNEQLKK
ncbi:MAG: alpha/beta hydrolase [Bacteroidetes bacterium]|jgi:uncharacterized protein|nr:alpha/beta hydrolase [Bacteroidota bacterium]MBT6688077.1 alpha/beta hydrolase [Bacteroidota bacterium]MBT7142330.1 alpha/beta hydrolase [Bacteroidota bacterium]MBT7491144.1 alpha/beta hydrolase [Bacteroidota bacterium]